MNPEGMNPTVLKTLQAERDLLELWVYLAEYSPQNADKSLKALEAQMNMLATMPQAGRAREELLSGLRSFVGGSHVIYYRPVAEGVLIMRVLHGSRRAEDLFPGDLNASE